MSTQAIIESGMAFGPYPEGQCFHIEKSDCYAVIGEHVKMAEFLLLRLQNEIPVIWIVEAKSSTPRPETQPNFENFVAEVREKLINAFSLGWASFLNRHCQAEAELPEGFKSLDLSQVDVKFVLVVNGHRLEWLPPLQDALGIAMRSTIRTWAFSPTSVAVMNDSLAMQHGLILSAQEGGV